MSDPRPTLEAPDDDPYLWLEGVESPQATAWVDARTADTLARFGDAGFAADRDVLRGLLDRPDRIAYPTRRGGFLYNFWRDAGHPRGVWRRTTLESYRLEAPVWDILLDVDALAESEGEDWVFQGAGTLPPEHDRAMLRLSRGGSDAVVLREFDVAARCFVADGFVLPEAKGGVVWLDRDTLLLSSAAGGATRSGYARTVRLWARGVDPASAPVLFETDAVNMAAWGMYDRVDGRLVFGDRTGFFDGNTWLGDRSGPGVKLDLPTDAHYSFEFGYLVVQPRTPYLGFAADTLLGIGLAAFLAGERGFAVLVEPAPRTALQGFYWVQGKLVVSLLDELQPLYRVFTPGVWTDTVLEGLPSIGTVHAWPLDGEAAESDGSLLAMTEDPLTPPTLLLTQVAGGAPAVLKTTPAAFDAAGLVVRRFEAVSSDGERIPYVVTGPAEQTGEAPVHLSGYGGFAISRLPGYGVVSGKLWLERGGTAVVANIRGGGEFGTRWHEAGRREGKRLSHDDFAGGGGGSGDAGDHAAGADRGGGRVERWVADRQYADAVPGAVRRIVLHHPADRYVSV